MGLRKRNIAMGTLLDRFQTAYVETQNIMPFLADYTNPRDYISRLVKKGDLIRLKNGFFIIANRIRETRAPYEQISNLLYGPSYISLEWALSIYGMIPEGVYVVTSVSTKQTKRFETPIGNFEYSHLSHSRYAIGIDQKQNSSGNYLIATPEKALADLIYFKSKNLSKKDLLIDLIEARRIDESQLKQLNKQLLLQIAEQYRSQVIKELTNMLGII